MINTKCFALIVAGGTGSRMNSELPKQFILLNGLPVLMHTITVFRNSTYKPQIILVLNPNYMFYWKEICQKYNFNIPHQVVRGGENRFYSVKNGLELIPNESLVAVHDGVRPFVSSETITYTFDEAFKAGNACCAISSRDSIRISKNKRKTIAVDREKVYLMQTPQTFEASILKKAYQQPYNSTFTDEATVAETFGERINLVKGEITNIKITYKEDLI